MTSSTTINIDLAIIGGGIAGLWTLALARKRGISAILIEKEGLGGKQTIASQGIIHGGTKYALKGHLSGAAQAIAKMPQAWKDALAGKGEVDLSSAKLLSQHQYLWTTTALSGKMTSFFASKVMRSRMQKIASDALPDFFPSDFQGHCYALEEPVFDVASVLESLAKPHQEAIFTDCFWLKENDHLILPEKDLVFCPKTWLFSAGEENQSLSKAPQQLRPLHMLAWEVPKTHAIYGHCLGMSDKPKITITTHPSGRADSQIYWLGGHIAESGLTHSHEAQVKRMQACLKETVAWLPDEWIEDEMRFHSIYINRAEGRSGGARPDMPIIETNGNILTVWPTKLAFAPLVAEQCLAHIRPSLPQPTALPAHSVRIAHALWQDQHIIPKGARVLAFGDSLTRSMGADEGETYPEQLALRTQWQIDNEGVSGNTTAQALERLPEALAQADYELVILCIAGNDFLQDLSLKIARDNIAKMIERIQAKKIPLVILGVPSDIVGKTVAAGKPIPEDFPMYRELADRYRCYLFSDGWGEVLAKDDQRSDEIHPNGKGYTLFAEKLYQFLRLKGLAQ